MAPVKVDPDRVREFRDAECFYKWLGKHHDKESELWIKIHKLDSGLASVPASASGGLLGVPLAGRPTGKLFPDQQT